MKVSELAKELGTNSETVLKTLKSLKLKAKDSKQELNVAVLSVVKSAVKKVIKDGKEVDTKGSSAEKKTTKKTVVKKKIVAKKKVAKKAEEKVKVKVTKKVVKKKLVKKKVVKQKDSTKVKTKISLEPLITLKPLSRKKRKSRTKDDGAESENTEVQSKAADQLALMAGQADGVSADDDAATLERDAALPDIEIKVPISVKDLATRIQQKPSQILTELMRMGIMANINQGLDGDIVQRIVRAFGFNLAKIKTEEEALIEVHKQEDEDPSLLKDRAPVVTFMGHVDHGKTSLLDRVRKSKVADSEHGGITQHMGAYSVEIPKGRITFLDTPGHEAFTAMRARGAHITDIVVLVVAADEGMMPQTQEAIDHARAADVPIVVALNKIDRKNADLDRVKKQLSEIGLNPEDWGGDTVCVGVSATTGEGIDHLLELILLEAELLELKANPDKRASGIVVEAHLSQGKGVVTTLIVQSGTLKDSDYIVVGPYYGKVRVMHDDHNRIIKAAGPSMPVEILGLADVPDAGEIFYVVEDEKQARDITFKRQEDLKNKKLQAYQKISLEDLSAQIEQGVVKELNVILKADVQGSLGALQDSLAKIPSDKVKLKFIHEGVGDVNASDVLLAVASKAIIIAFHVGVDARAKKELEKEPVEIRTYRIIYDAVDDMRNALEGMLEAKKNKVFQARVEIREVFKLSKSGIVAGCYVQKGKVNRKAHIDILREDEVIYSGVLGSLKRFKDDVRDVNEGMECGITIDGFKDIQSGDMIEVYDIESIAQKL